ncbi:MAG: DUF1302 family protein [Gammaproteobacteria bacterium]
MLRLNTVPVRSLKVLSVLGVALYLASAPAAEFDASIKTAGRWGINTNSGDSQMLNLSLKPEFDLKFENGWQLKSVLRMRTEAIGGARIAEIERGGYSEYSKPELLTPETELELREFSLHGQIGKTYLILGKQQIVWGKADGLKVLDIINPQSYREFILEDFEESRIPLWTVNVERSWRDWELQFLWIPDQSYHALPKQNATFAFTSPELVPVAPPGAKAELVGTQRPNNAFLDSDAGFRASTFWRGWDITFNYLYQYDNLPALKQRLSLMNGQPLVTVTPEYSRTHVFGSTFSNAFDDWVVRGEFAYFSQHSFIGRDPRLNNGIVQSPELHYVLGLDWNAPADVLVSAQLIQSWMIADSGLSTRDKLDTTFTGVIRRNFMYDTLTAEVLVIANVNHLDGIVRPKVKYQWQDNLTTWIGADIFYGDRLGRFGQFGANDRIVFGVELDY